MAAMAAMQAKKVLYIFVVCLVYNYNFQLDRGFYSSRNLRSGKVFYQNRGNLIDLSYNNFYDFWSEHAPFLEIKLFDCQKSRQGLPKLIIYKLSYQGSNQF